ncbi:hypothetical protein [Glaciecola sp. 1036]|uniref:hypothetical protein n=1 Tax=Alteromonadaceae TaxID=72275 RepID=UPI003D07193E
MTSATQTKSNWISRIVWITVLVVLLLVVYKITSNDPPPVATNSVPFDDRLLACNQVSTAELTDDFNTCLEMANEGWRKAQMKVAWAFVQPGEYQDVKAAFKWVSLLSRHNRNAELVSYIMLFVFGDTDEDKVVGEKGIKKLANINFAPASAYLGILYKLGQNSLVRTSDPIWLLERAHQQDPTVFDAYQMATIYANGFGVEKNFQKAKQVLLKHADYDYPITTNNVAWFLATLEENPMTSPETAISLAQSVVENEQFHENHIYVDTLAATYAANQEFQQAVEYQQQAIALLNTIAEQNDKQNTAKLLEEYQARLELYKNNKKAVTETLDRESDKFFAGVKAFVEHQLLNQLNATIEAPDIELSTTQIANPEDK